MLLRSYWYLSRRCRGQAQLCQLDEAEERKERSRRLAKQRAKELTGPNFQLGEAQGLESGV